MLRIFVGLEIPDPLRERLALLQAGLPNVRWVAPGNFHVTLRFAGDIHEDVAADIDDELIRLSLPGFKLQLTGMGMFEGRGRVRAIWAGLAPSPPLERLQGKTEQACRRAGLAPEGRKFKPHVTLAWGHGVPLEMAARFVAENDGFRSEPFAVRRFCLYSSAGSGDTREYRVEAAYPLSDEPADDA